MPHKEAILSQKEAMVSQKEATVPLIEAIAQLCLTSRIRHIPDTLFLGIVPHCIVVCSQGSEKVKLSGKIF